jgi:IS30 family transposase
MPRLSNNDRNQALGMLREGISTREVARLFNCHQSTVVRLRQRFQTTNNVSDRPRPGQPRVTADQQDRHIRLQHLHNRFKTAVVEQLLWLICLLSTYPKLGCDHYYSDVAFLKPNKNFTIANSADI